MDGAGAGGIGPIFRFLMAGPGPAPAIVVVDVALDIADGEIVAKPVLEDLFCQLFLVDRFQRDAGCNLKMPAVGRDFATRYLHFFRRVSAALCSPFFSGSFFMLGVSFAKRFATSGSRAKR